MTETLAKLTPKQEGWYEDWQRSGNAAQAYRDNYNAEGMTVGSIHTAAHQLSTNPKITMRLKADRTRKQADNKALEDRAKAFSEECITTAATIMRNEKAPESARMAAIKELLDRGHGKPISKTELDATLNKGNGTASDLSDAELMALLKPKGEG